MSRYGTDERIEQRDAFKFIRMPRSGKLFGFHDAIHKCDVSLRAMSRNTSRAFKLLSADSVLSTGELERIGWMLDDVEAWLGAIRRHLAEAYGVKDRERRIAALRNVAGRTPEEAEAFLAKADELEGRTQ